MKQPALMKRATASGVTDEKLEDAEDEDDHKSAVVKLIVQADTAGGGAIGSRASAPPEGEDDILLVLTPRFPLVGGWKTSFETGYRYLPRTQC